jgi:hypothetical protein
LAFVEQDIAMAQLELRKLFFCHGHRQDIVDVNAPIKHILRPEVWLLLTRGMTS